MHRLILSVILLFVCAGNINAQGWSDAEFKKANTADQTTYLSNEEKDVIFFMNLSRLDGKKFFDTFLQDYIADYNNSVKKYRNYNQLKIAENNPYYLSLKKHLYGIKNLNMLYPDENLSYTSKLHALDLYNNNIDTHESSNGESFAQRLRKVYPNFAASENIDFGYYKSLEIVCHLLLDCGVPSLGHRINILDQKYNFNYVGVNIQKHKTHSYCTVIDFVAKPSTLTLLK